MEGLQPKRIEGAGEYGENERWDRQYRTPKPFDQTELDKLTASATKDYLADLNSEQARLSRYQMNVEPTEQINEARALSREQFSNARDVLGRTSQRYGLDLTGDRARVTDRQFANMGSLAEVNAANATRDAVEARDLGLTNQLIAAGRGLASDSMATYGATAAAENARNARNDARDDADRAAKINTAVGLAGLGLSLVGI